MRDPRTRRDDFHRLRAAYRSNPRRQSSRSNKPVALLPVRPPPLFAKQPALGQDSVERWRIFKPGIVAGCQRQTKAGGEEPAAKPGCRDCTYHSAASIRQQLTSCYLSAIFLIKHLRPRQCAHAPVPSEFQTPIAAHRPEAARSSLRRVFPGASHRRCVARLAGGFPLVA